MYFDVGHSVVQHLNVSLDDRDLLRKTVVLADFPGQLLNFVFADGCSGVMSFSLKGDRDTAIRFMDSLKLASYVVHVADIRTCVLHPASATHRQLSDEQLVAAGITPGMIRLSVGLEHVDDILDDIKQALEKI